MGSIIIMESLIKPSNSENNLGKKIALNSISNPDFNRRYQDFEAVEKVLQGKLKNIDEEALITKDLCDKDMANKINTINRQEDQARKMEQDRRREHEIKMENFTKQKLAIAREAEQQRLIATERQVAKRVDIEKQIAHIRQEKTKVRLEYENIKRRENEERDRRERQRIRDKERAKQRQKANQSGISFSLSTEESK